MGAHDDAWEARFEALFPAYLLPSAMRSTLDATSAARLVQRILGVTVSLDRFRASTFVAAHHDAIADFALRLLPDVCRGLHGRTHVERRSAHGVVAGRLDAPQTLLARMRGGPDMVVSRTRVRRFDHAPEVALRATVLRLLAALRVLGADARDDAPVWAPDVMLWIAALQRTLDRSALHRVDGVPFEAGVIAAMEGQRHPAYACATRLARGLHDTLDARDPGALARCVERGALWPLEDWRRFELAVALTLAQSIERALVASSSAWGARHAIIDAQREEILAFEHPDGRRVRVFYNQSPLPAGARTEAITHYFGAAAASRPDVTVLCERPDAPPRAVVVEVKLSANASYLHGGFDEATVYAMEYADLLVPIAGSVLVVPRALKGKPRSTDRVVAYGWRDWLEPTLVVEQIVAAVNG